MRRSTLGREKGRPKGATGESTRKAVRENASKPRTVLAPDVRAQYAEAKRIMAEALTEKGALYIAEIIRMGPFATVMNEGKHGEMVPVALYQDKSQVWQYAMNFAADRAGLPRISELELAATEGLPAIEVRFPGFAKPADS